jgi:hypothetical protein
MHEHFHQMQDGQPGFFDAVNGLGLAHGDKTGMWMLNYPFPYEKPELVNSFGQLRDLLLTALNEQNNKRFHQLVRQYIAERHQFLAQLTPDDGRYLNFQLWREGIARYVQMRAAEMAAHYVPSPEYRTLGDYESFEIYAAKARTDTISELKRVDLAKWKRVAVYPFGACEGLLLDRLNPKWRDGYFRHLFTLDPYFENNR